LDFERKRIKMRVGIFKAQDFYKMTQLLFGHVMQ
jgi:hypothetical protein